MFTRGFIDPRAICKLTLGTRVYYMCVSVKITELTTI